MLVRRPARLTALTDFSRRKCCCERLKTCLRWHSPPTHRVLCPRRLRLVNGELNVPASTARRLRAFAALLRGWPTGPLRVRSAAKYIPNPQRT
eukprot:2083867-Prymnesium_polylepis.2